MVSSHCAPSEHVWICEGSHRDAPDAPCSLFSTYIGPISLSDRYLLYYIMFLAILAWKIFIPLPKTQGKITPNCSSDFILFQIEKNRGNKGGYSSISSSGRIDSSFSDMSISSGTTGFGSASGFGSSADVDSFSNQSRGPNCRTCISFS